VDIGSVLSEAWSLYTRFLLRFFLTAFAVFVVLDLFSALADVAADDSFLAGLFWSVLAAIVGIVGLFLVQAALLEVVRDVRDGRADRGLGETYSAVWPRVPALIAASVIAAVVIGIGLLLLIVPGLYLLTIWSMIAAVIVLEGRSAGESFSRSHELVRGNGWNVFGLIVVVFIIVAVASGLIRLVFAWLPDFLDAWIGALVAHSLTIPFAAAALATAYFQLIQVPPAPPAPPEPPAPPASA
jgi:hypothetical protein